MTTLKIGTEDVSGKMFVRTAVISGRDDGQGLTFELDLSGATLVLSVRQDGAEIAHEAIRLTDLTQQWVKSIVDRVKEASHGG